MPIKDFIDTMLNLEQLKRQRVQDALNAQVTRQQQLTSGLSILANAPSEARATLIPMLAQQGVGSVEELSSAATAMPESTPNILARLTQQGVGAIDPKLYAIHSLLGTTPGAMAMDQALAGMSPEQQSRGATNQLGLTMTAAQEAGNQRQVEGNELQRQQIEASLMMNSANNRLQYQQLAQQYGIAMAQINNDLEKIALKSKLGGSVSGEDFAGGLEELRKLNDGLQAVSMPPEAQAQYRALMAAQIARISEPLKQAGLNPDALIQMLSSGKNLQGNWFQRRGK